MLGIALLHPVAAQADPDPPTLVVDGAPSGGSSHITLVSDQDDDDDNGVADHVQASDIPPDDLRLVTIAARGKIQIQAQGNLRLVHRGTPTMEVTLTGSRGRPASVFLQGVTPSSAADDSAVVVKTKRGEARLSATVVQLRLLRADNHPHDPTRDALALSFHVTNDHTLLRHDAWDSVSADPRNFRVELLDPRKRGDTAEVTLRTRRSTSGARRGRRKLELRRPRPGLAYRSASVRLVADRLDEHAPGVGGRLLRAAPRDRVVVEYRAPDGRVAQSTRVGRPGRENGPLASRLGTLRIRILRVDGVPVVGVDERGALRIGRQQVRIANEVWYQCMIGFGDPDDADIRVVDPPVTSLIAVGDADGLPAKGGGQIMLSAGGRSVGPVATRAGASPASTALDIAEALERAGFHPRVTENPRTEFGANRSADVLVRDRRGDLVKVAAAGPTPLSTDARQSVKIVKVDLHDGLQEFNNMTATAGTAEERALVKALGDDDPTTIDIFVVNRFTGGTRQGEAFIEGDEGSMLNALILDRNGILQQREAWTVAHELGHVLLDYPLHPDQVGPDRPWLLMDSDSSLGLVTGPKRLTPDQCARVRHRSGSRASPPLLRPHED